MVLYIVSLISLQHNLFIVVAVVAVVVARALGSMNHKPMKLLMT